ncbi:MAG: nodulation protein NfeD [Myxococcota bacterium]
MNAALRCARSVPALIVTLLALSASAGHVNVVTIDGSINPASSDHIQSVLRLSEEDGAAALLIELDTPGGLLAATKDIIQAILNSRVPVVVYVSPRGAWAASAGTFITLAGHIAAMAPGTSIGAASPVSASGGGGERGEDNARTDVSMEKAEKFTMAFIESIAKERNRNVEWALSSVREAEAIAQDEALKLGVIDVVADSRDDLFAQIEGRVVEVEGGPWTLALVGAEVREIEMAPLTRLFNFLASPDIAMILVMAGLLGLYVEFQQPGMLAPGIAGAVCLVLAAIAFQILPFSWVGLILILFGVALMVAEVFVTSFGLLFAGGIVCFLLGGTMLFDMPEVSDLTVSFWTVLLPTVAGFAVCAAVVIYAVGRSLVRRQMSGVNELIGLVGDTHTALAPVGKVFVRGEYWNAEADEEIPSGERVEVTGVEGMRLRVRRSMSRA